MLNRIVRGALSHPRTVVAISLLVAALGGAGLFQARYAVFPNFAPPHVLIQTEAPGLDARQVEALVTRPLEDLLLGTQGVASVRSTSSQGLSAISVVFAGRASPYRRRQAVVERLRNAAALLPAGTGSPRLSPLSSSLSYLLHFGFTSDTLSPSALRSLVRWTLEPQILAVPGVANVTLYGGGVRERQVVVDPLKLQAAGLDLTQVFSATRRATTLIGGGYVETPAQRIVLQPQTPGATPQALADAVIATRDGTRVRLGDVASVRDGTKPRFGAALIGDQPGVLVETTTQLGANTLSVTRALEKRLDELVPALKQQGVVYHPGLLRPATAIVTALEHLRASLLIGAVLVAIMLLLALRNWRGALISFASIPLSLLTTVLILNFWGLSLNTMSIAGLVVALGVVVDDAVIDVENITRRRRIAMTGTNLHRLFVDASLEVRRPVFYATAAVVVAFAPIYLLPGVQGRFFRPLSLSFMIAVGVSLLVAMSTTPALCALLMKAHRPRPEARMLAWLKCGQIGIIRRLYRHPRGVVVLLALSAVVGALLLTQFGQRLMPAFHEDELIAHSVLRPGVSLAETQRVDARIVRQLSTLPSIRSVDAQIGRAENGQDPATPNITEFEIQLVPAHARRYADVMADIRAVFARFPELKLTELNSVLAERIGETFSGESAPFFVSVFGNNLDTDDHVAGRIAEVLRKLPHSGGVQLRVPPRQPQLEVRLLPEKLALYGLQAADALRALNLAYQGDTVSHLNEADRSIPVVVRLAGGADNPQAVKALLLRSPDGALIRLGKVALIKMVKARALVAHAGGLRRQVITASPRTSDLAGYARAARSAIATQVTLPAGVYLRYGGNSVKQTAAARQLLLHAGAALALIVLLMALAFGRTRDVILVLLALPGALLGGALAVAATGAILSLGAMVGFVAMFGISARNTILLVAHYDYLIRVERQPWNLATALRASEERLTPILLTAVLTALALLPVAVQAHQPGHEIEGPMAIVILGSLVSSTIVSLLLIPPLAARWLRPQAAAETLESAAAPSNGAE